MTFGGYVGGLVLRGVWGEYDLNTLYEIIKKLIARWW